MKKYAFCMVMVAMLLMFGGPLMADVGITNDCQDDIADLKDEMKRDKDDYTAESRRKAEAQLAAARTNRMDPIKCRKNLQDARQELRQGKREKKHKDD